MELRQWALRLLRWWWLMLAAVLVSGISSYLVARDQPPTYQSTVTLRVGHFLTNPNPSGGDLQMAQQLTYAYSEIGKRAPVRAATMGSLGLTGLPPYNIRPVPNTDLIELSVVDTDPARAQAVANELAAQLIRQSPTASEEEQEQRQAFVESQLNELQATIAETQLLVSQYKEDLAKMTSARQIADTQAQIDGLEAKVRTSQQTYGTLLASTKRGAVNSLRVFESAPLPRWPMGRSALSDVGLAMMIGLALGFCGAYLLEYLDDTMHSTEDVKRDLAVATLGAIPAHRGTPSLNGSGRGNAVAVAQAYRALASSVRSERPVGSPRRLLVTSARPAESKSLTAAGLAMVLARSGQRVVLVDADVQGPRLHRLLRLENTAGLADALSRNGSDSGAPASGGSPAHPGHLDGLLQPTQVPGLSLLPAGALPQADHDILTSERIRALLAELQDGVDTVVFDAPPVQVAADALILAQEVDQVLLVVETGRTRRETARRALAALARVDAPVAGAVLTRVDPQRA